MWFNASKAHRTKEDIIHLREQHKRGEVRIIDDTYASIAMGALANGQIGTFQSFAVLSAGHEWLKNTLLTMDLKSMSGDGCFMSDGQITLQNPGNCDQVPSRRVLMQIDETGVVMAKMECGCKDGVDTLFSGATQHRAIVTYKGEHFTEALKRGIEWTRQVTKATIVLMSALVMEPACGEWWADTTDQVVSKYGYDKVVSAQPQFVLSDQQAEIADLAADVNNLASRPIKIEVNISGRDIAGAQTSEVGAISAWAGLSTVDPPCAPADRGYAAPHDDLYRPSRQAVPLHHHSSHRRRNQTLPLHRARGRLRVVRVSSVAWNSEARHDIYDAFRWTRRRESCRLLQERRRHDRGSVVHGRVGDSAAGHVR